MALLKTFGVFGCCPRGERSWKAFSTCSWGENVSCGTRPRLVRRQGDVPLCVGFGQVVVKTRSRKKEHAKFMGEVNGVAIEDPFWLFWG